MRSSLLAVLACAVLSACTSEPEPTPLRPAAAAVPIAAVTPPPSLETMRAALPTFDVLVVGADTMRRREVSVIRDLIFPTGGSILTRDQVNLLAPLLIYLRANPGIGVHVEAYGDGKSAEVNEALARDRAQAIVRALLTDMRVSNAMSVAAAAGPQLTDHRGTGNITFIIP